MEVVDIKKIFVPNLLIHIYLRCVRSSLWCATTLATLPSIKDFGMFLALARTVFRWNWNKDYWKKFGGKFKRNSNLQNILRTFITFYRSLLHSLFTNLICFSSKFWDLPDHWTLPRQELFLDKIKTKTAENLAGNQIK